MSEQPTAPTEPTPGADPGATPTLTDAHAEVLLADAIAAAEAANGAPSGDSKPWDNPEAARAEIERLRRENGAARTNAKQTAADEARNALVQDIGRALGLVQEDGPLDPTRLTEQLTAEQANARAARLELAVFRAAGGDVDANALLDSRSFLEKAATLDPSDGAAIKAVIDEAVAANPRLGKPVAAQGMRPNPAQGASASPPLGLNQQIAAAEQAGDMKTAIRLKSRLLIDQTPGN